MDFNEWGGWYKEILDTLGFSREGDENTAALLDKILDEKGCLTIEEFSDEIMEKKDTSKFIVVGAGPSIKKHIKYVKENYDLNDYLIVSADGATTAMLEDDLVPDIVATDLDGKMDDLLAANSLGSYFVVHAHGDNEELIVKWTTSFDKILGTTQSKPVGHLYNFGGFTDGDRAMFFTLALGCEEMVLAGMDFGTNVTKYSRPNIEGATGPADEIKTKKLIFAERLLAWIKENTDVKVINLVDIDK
ncbi:6-hydroxymethylpterin diphosphokinase MptE-like protein [Methanobrevibacter ruminantium]|uniref:6-hydroxymethylpterin diphosphokinase MptE-like protein n=1 Tax=Methanobrevibacter ruminantium TaxID=83816 RepID=UPI0026F33F1C|nr:6-hydroxymethylpterin diphosphokinase MptE-like protein [Methanobrevibacter ruminantium]